MYTIVGSGFGLYGYLPALVLGLGETVLLPQDWKSVVKARPELSGTLQGIRWFDDHESALSAADAVVIATPPLAQVEWVNRCARLENVTRIILEKPVAPTPAQANALLKTLAAQGKRYRVGYTLLHTDWNKSLCWPKRAMSTEPICLIWNFNAYHFASDLYNWKRRHLEGGGVLRFFGIHVIALLAEKGYETVITSILAGADHEEPERWQATFTGPELPNCKVVVDSRCSNRCFSIFQNNRPSLVTLGDPFENTRSDGYSDARVEVLTRVLASFIAEDQPLNALYKRTNKLWAEVEATTT